MDFCCLIILRSGNENTKHPSFLGTIFIAGEIITSSDPSAFIKLSSADSGKRLMFDRRLDDFVYYDAILFNAHYNDGLQIEVQVNPEFKSYEEAKTIALKYAKPIGQLTTALRKDVKTVWIHKGNNLFGGGNNNLLIHTEQGDEYIKDGILEETLVHEAVHTSIDPYYAKDPLWIEAQKQTENLFRTMLWTTLREKTLRKATYLILPLDIAGNVYLKI